MTDRHQTAPTSVRIHPVLRHWLTTYAEDNAETVHGVIIDAIAEYRDRHGRPEPLLTDEQCDFAQEWYCEPPSAGTRYRVITDYWRSGSKPVREIHGIDLLPGNG